MFEQILQECSYNFGIAPRRFYVWDRFRYLNVPRPNWVLTPPIDPLEMLFLNIPYLWEHGRVVWGHIVQANSQLFEPGPTSCPAEVVYSLDDQNPAMPDALALVARELFSLKNTSPADARLAPIADHLTDEVSRTFGLGVPRSVSPDHRCRVSTTFIVRKHLPGPNHCLTLGFFPLVASPTDPFVVLPLPSRYWPADFLEIWLGAEGND